MNDFMTRFSINCHSSIRCGGDTVLWFDPFRVENTPADGDVIFVTHEHYDHFSPEDIRRVMKADAVLVLPESCRETALAAGFAAEQIVTVAGRRVYVAGDTDDTPEARAVRCDAAFLPAGGTYTMTAAEAAALANAIHPQAAVPTHYGSIVGEKTDGDAFAAALDAGIRCVKLL